MSFARFALALAASVSLVGCAYVPLGKVPQLDVASLASGKASLQVWPQVAAGGYRTQTLPTNNLLPYAQSDVAKLRLSLFRVANGTESAVINANNVPLTKEILNADLGQPVGFTNLHPNTTYLLKAVALDAQDNVISEAASSNLQITVVTDQRPTVGNLVVQLKNRLFRAEGTSSIDVTPGGYDTDFEDIAIAQAPLGITITGVWDNFTVNGQPNGVGYTYRYTPRVSAATVSLPVNNYGADDFYVRDYNNPNPSNGVHFPIGATGSVTVYSQDGALDVEVMGPT
ncbi:hypothetical protein J7643_11965 [bacterium]|nr:hypothetical protein [bacterium]